MCRTWEYCPTSERIVEDITRLPLVLDKIIEHKGGLVPDFEMAHNGCSKRKRGKVCGSAVPGASRSYQPPPEVAAAMQAKSERLRAKAEDMSVVY